MATALVRFDDRLQTVLRQPASDRHDAAVRWRQLVDLIARAGPSADSEGIAEALEVIRSDASRLDEPLRAAAARAIAALPLPLGLLECFIADGLAVSAPILAAASLDTTQWMALLGQADPETRRFVEALHPELAGRSAELTELLVRDQPDLPERASIGDVIARMEHRRKRGARSRLDSAAGPSVFRWECGPSGDIAWVDGAPRGALIGRSISKVRGENGDRVEEAALRAFAQRAPFRDCELTIGSGGAVSGTWKISAVPAFDPADGRFAGYRGIAIRQSAAQRRAAGEDQLSLDADSLRELVHEIKTPLNAIIGFAEIIDGQYLGPAGRRYRQRATGIVGEARLLLGAIDDLDVVARAPAAASADLAAIATEVAGNLKLEIKLARSLKPAMAKIDGESATRLVERLLQAVAVLAENGETIRVTTVPGGDKAAISVGRPRALAGAEGNVFGSDEDVGAVEPGRFSLRLVRGLARIAGGEIFVERDSLVLAFPAA